MRVEPCFPTWRCVTRDSVTSQFGHITAFPCLERKISGPFSTADLQVDLLVGYLHSLSVHGTGHLPSTLTTSIVILLPGQCRTSNRAESR